MPQNFSRERNLPEPLKIRTDWFDPSIAHHYLCSSAVVFEPQPKARARYVPNGSVCSSGRGRDPKG
jgi:hypothetical protein